MIIMLSHLGGYNKPGEAWAWTVSEDGGSWQKLPDLNHARFGHACVAFDQTVYLIGGQGGYKPVETYKLGEDKWVDIDSLPINSSRQAFVFDNKLLSKPNVTQLNSTKATQKQLRTSRKRAHSR